ncbi:TIGR03013 family XrtA/PEP-CTERM system glycosyltransferase [Neptunomonas antarctica]|uniref:Sugar transferase, PEP-CTERM system associated/exopolysaccharide biosynthesis polyprenyl glycosylphosphotransferase n=1 Tax=Neptunomonas antarctica TaxID=619304 RepID=A0A1N7JEZ9_9GAMM|nr:TIGR03013 family XrtA/PEP-CTERM system glycosyltransferase [Neptunomonas antarctica]SIS47925.1 sugar transferase, PEP-CTERM system associated/exopolysaccharide biosynthesis polyprenyl glycosylphosphotransferase [Neptunomonas antarctica]
MDKINTHYEESEKTYETEGPKLPSPRVKMRFCHGKFRVFGHYVHAQFLLLALFEFMLLTLLSYLVHLSFAVVDQSVPSFFANSASILLPPVLLSFNLAAMGLYDTRQRQRLVGVLSRLVVATFFGISIAIGINYFFPHTYSGYAVLPVTALASLAGLILIRTLFYSFVDGKVLRRRVLVLGAGKSASYIDNLRRQSDMRGVNLLGFIQLDNAGKSGISAEKLVSPGDCLCAYGLRNDVDEIVIALDDRRLKLPIKELLDCRMSGIDIIDMLDFFERERGLIQLDLLYPGWLIFAKGFSPDAFRTLKKRIVDLCVGLVLLVVFSPFMLLTTLAILLESRGKGSVLYRQQRVGRNGVVFNVIKFRSMRSDAEADGKAQWAKKDDSRVTRVGNFIRKYRLDELPQLWNVLVGDMSIVGPRPERPEFVSKLSHLNSLYDERHRLSPGVTGWAQLCYPYGASDEDSIQKLQYDLYYIKNHSVFLDMYILIQTVEVVLFKKGSR